MNKTSISWQLLAGLVCTQQLWAADAASDIDELKAAVKSVKINNDQIENKIKKLKAQLGQVEKSEKTLQDKAAELVSGIQSVWVSLQDRADKAELIRTQAEYKGTEAAYAELETYLVTLFKRRDAFMEVNQVLAKADETSDFGMTEFRALNEKMSQRLSDYNFLIHHP